MDPSVIQLLAVARDRVLDEWLAICSPQEKIMTAWYLLDGRNAEQMPMALRRSQERLLEALSESSLR